MAHPVYSSDFYKEQKKSSYKSAQIVLPLVFKWLKPKSVIDIGCGVGTWLKATTELGIRDFLGMDGAWAAEEKLWIPNEKFISSDFTKNFLPARSFDLTISLEIAEHLEEKYADHFINSLSKLSSAILFSAAIPFQGGHNHVNERWPTYWVKKFIKLKFHLLDCVRPKIWSDERVNPWYRQNILLFIHESKLKNFPVLGKLAVMPALEIVHPKVYLNTIKYLGEK